MEKNKNLLDLSSKESLKKLLIPADTEILENKIQDLLKPSKNKRKFPSARKMFKLLFPTADLRRGRDANAPKFKMIDPLILDCFQPKVRKAKPSFPLEAKEIIDEIRSRRKARNCGASYGKTGSMDMKNLICTPEKPPKDGVFQIRNPEGLPVLYVEYKDGKIHGVQKKFLNGVLSEIAYYKQGKLDGEMRAYVNGLCIRRFTYKNGVLNGPMVQYGKGGEPVMKTNFLNNQQHGICVVYTQGYMVSRTSFVKGKKQGMMRAFYPPHHPNEPQKVSKEIFYLNDVMEGPAFTYYPSGKKYMEENFLKNLKHGPCIEYYENGNIRKLSMYEHNKLTKVPEEYDYYGKKMTT